jgi:hypothetical protein
VYWTNTAVAFVYGWGIFLVYYFGGASDLGLGKPMDLYSYGVFTTCVSAILVHIQVAIIVRSWNIILIIMLIVSLV